MDTSNDIDLKQTSESSASTAIKGFAVTLLLIQGASSLLSICAVGVPLLHFAIGESLASTVGYWAVLAAVLFALVLVPAHVLCKKTLLNHAVYADYVGTTGGDPYCSPLDPQTISILKDEVCFQQRVIGSRCNCEAASSALAAILAYLCQRALLALVGSPWAYSLTLVLIPVVSLVISAILVNVTGKSYKRENPELYAKVIELLQSAGR